MSHRLYAKPWVTLFDLRVCNAGCHEIDDLSYILVKPLHSATVYDADPTPAFRTMLEGSVGAWEEDVDRGLRPYC